MAKNKPEYVRHSVSTAIFSILLANAVGETPLNVTTLAGLGGLLHDIGMVNIPKDIDELNPKLSIKERIELEKHPYLGVKLLEQAFNCPKALNKVILEHHERWDGTGYPHNLSGENIHFVSRIVAIADYFSSLSRLKHKGSNIPAATIIRMMKKKNWFDPYLLDTFAKLLRI